VDDSGYISNTGSACGSGSGGSGAVSSGVAGQIAYYAANGTTVGGMNTVPVATGGTGASTSAGALVNLGAEAIALTGSGAPSGACSSSVNNGTFYTSSALNLYQCSSATGVYQWNPVGGNGSTGVSSLNSLAGAVNVIAGAGISVTPSGSSITIGNTGNGAPSVYFNVQSYGAKADMLPLGGYVSASLTLGSATLYVSSGSFTSADVGKYVVFQPNGGWTKPFSTGPSIAQILSVTDGQHLVLSKTAATTENAYVWWGTDNVPAFNACAVAVYNAGWGGACAIPVGQYLLATAPYYTISGMAQDDGGYNTPAGGSGAAVTAAVSGGAITGYTVTNGGSGYPRNAQMQVTFSGGCPAVYAGPCGGEFAIANTNSSGIVASITPVYNGYGLAAPPMIAVVPLGGDGATATCTLAGGTCGSPSITAGGSGYPTSSSGVLEMWAFNAPGGSCANIGGGPGGTAVLAGKGSASSNSSGAIASATWTTAPSGCGATAPTIVFGDVSCWNSGTSSFTAQCANIAPLLPAAIPYQVSTFGVSWYAPTGASQSGAVVSGSWDDTTVDTVTPGTMLTQPAMFGGEIQNGDFGGLTVFGAFIGIYDPYNFNRSKIHDSALNAGIGMVTAASDVGAQVDNLFFGGYAPWVNGGQWSHRTDYVIGGGGFFAPYSVSNLTSIPVAYNSVAAAIDTWFAEEFWRPEFTASAVDMPETCAFPQAANQRQTSRSLTNGVGNANGMCYKGVAGFGFLNLARDHEKAQPVPITNLVGKGIYRPLFYGSLGPAALYSASCEVCFQVASDPYRAEPVQEGAIEFSDAAGAQINSVAWSGSQVVQPIYDLSGLAAAGVAGAPQDVAWQNDWATSTVNGQAAQNLNIQSQIVNPQGELLSYNAGTNAQAALTFGNASSTSTPANPTIAGGIKGDGYATGSYSLYGQNFTNKLATFYLDSFNIDAPFYFANGIAPASGTNCLQVSSTGQVTSTGSACGGGGTVSSFAAPSGSWPSWLVPTVANAASTPSLTVTAQSTGTGSVVLANGPTFTGNATTFANGAAAEQDVAIQPGTGGDQIGAFGWNNYAGTSEWKLKKDASNYLRLTDVVNSLDREIFYQNGQTLINSGAGANAVLINGTANSGAGGFAVESGGASPAAVLSVTGSGNTTATGFVSGKFMMGSGTMSLATGAAAGTGPAIACASGHACDGVSGTVTLTTGTSTTTGTLATLSYPNTHTNSANCVVDVLQSGVGRVTTATWSESTTALTLTANTALTASTAYTVKYWCGGN
jgi:hypothetical protein